MSEELFNHQDFETLKSIGVERIKRDTKIDASRISDILEKRFEKFDYIRAKGFIHILEKEYHLDLSSWLEEYRLVCLSCQNDDCEDKAEEEYCKKIRRKKIMLIGTLVFFLFVALLLLAKLLKNDERVALQLSAVEEQIKPKEEDLIIETNENTQTPQEENVTEEKEEPKQETKQIQVVINKPLDELGTPIFEGIELSSDEVISLAFERPIWVGVIDLQSKRRSAQIQKTFDIPLDREQLIYSAYGSFKLSVGSNEMRFNTYKPIFLIYTQSGGIRQISKEEYLFANGGVEW